MTFTTKANSLGTAAFSNVTTNSIQANWTANGNPSGTQYYCENTTKGTNSNWITSTSWNSTGLSANTTYHFQVKARNEDGVETNWTDLGSQKTPILGDFGSANNGPPDCVVDFEDLMIFALAYGSIPSDSNWNPVCDIACPGGLIPDGVIDFEDLMIFAMHYGETCADM